MRISFYWLISDDVLRETVISVCLAFISQSSDTIQLQFLLGCQLFEVNLCSCVSCLRLSHNIIV